MNYPVWYLPDIGGGLLIALIAVLHVFVSHFAVGGGLYLIFAEKKALREKSEALMAFTKNHARFFLLVTMVFGSITGVGIWFIIALVNPAATSQLIHIFVFGWAAEWVFFGVEIASAFVFFYMFGKMDWSTHLKVGWLYFFSAWMSLVLINGIIGFMITPGGWLENRSFWAAFFNPSFLPSLGFRTMLCFLLAGVYGYLVSAWTHDRQVRLAMTRFSGKWSFFALLGAVPFGLWYVAVLPGPAQQLVLGKSPTIVTAVQYGAAGVAVLLLLTLSVGIVRPDFNLKPVALLAMIVALASMGGFEWTREAARRPYAINEVMFSNMIMKADIDTINEKGFLQLAKWVENKTVDDRNRMAAGEELFINQCYACHTLGGINNDLKKLTDKMSYTALQAYLGRIHQVRYFMPPFVGKEQEGMALASYIVGGVHGKEVDALRDENKTGSATGAQQFEKTCAACHVPEDLVTATAGLSKDELVGLLGRLNEISEEMEPFEGTPEETGLLASFLFSLNAQQGQAASAEPTGTVLFETNCASCHTQESMTELVNGWEKGTVREALDKLEKLSDEMPPYEGSPEEKDVLAGYLFDLGGAKQ